MNPLLIPQLALLVIQVVACLIANRARYKSATYNVAHFLGTWLVVPSLVILFVILFQEITKLLP